MERVLQMGGAVLEPVVLPLTVFAVSLDNPITFLRQVTR